MHFLKLDDNKKPVLTRFIAGDIPNYAILSHTWEADDQEVTFKDLSDGVGLNKLGYGKIQFCGERAREDGLQYFWVDSCNIDKSSSAELQEAINSMFRWYRNAVKCYVYLSDVSTLGSSACPEILWELAFSKSRWFTRGWTLQELLAPLSVEFFSREGKRLGDNKSLEAQIQRVTGIPAQALRGTPLSKFSIDVRMSWATKRRTTIEEDQAYCLLGIFDTYLPLIYGEGKENAFRRLRKEIEGSDERVPRPSSYVPFPRNMRFIGRFAELKAMEQTLFVDQESQRLALVGLGGVGKTQIALEFAHSVKKTRPEYSVFWMAAHSMGGFEQTCTDIARTLKIAKPGENQEDVKELVRWHLSTEIKGPWLLVVDNVDDLNLFFGSEHIRGIAEYLPHSEDGRIIFTTRTQEAAVALAGVGVVKVTAMSSQDALDFLRKSLIGKEELSNVSITMEFLSELAHLPLAISQAIAYLNTNDVSISEYLRLLKNTEEDMVSLLSRDFYTDARYKGSDNAVATTWLMSFNQILKHDQNAADLLSFMSCIEPKAIPHSILPPIRPQERMVHSIGTLCAYTFVVRRLGENTYDVHRLVHMATRIWLHKQGLAARTIEKAIRRVTQVFPSDNWESHLLFREYLPHALRLLESNEARTVSERDNLSYWVGRCLRMDGKVGESVQWLEESLQWREEKLNEDHPDRLDIQKELAKSYLLDGQVGKAVKMLEYIVAFQQKLNLEGHSASLHSQHELGRAYLADGQIGKAVRTLENVDTLQKIQGEESVNLLWLHHELATTYVANGQAAKAVELLERVVGIRKNSLAEDHPDLLWSQHELGRAYLENRQPDKALVMLEHVVTVRQRIQGEEHRELLWSQHELARAYLPNGKLGKAIELMEHVVSIRQKLRPEEHRELLWSQHELGRAYIESRRIGEAMEILKHVVATRQRNLNEEHPDLLWSQHELARAYLADGKVGMAVELMKHVVTIKARLLEVGNPSRLISEKELAAMRDRLMSDLGELKDQP